MGLLSWLKQLQEGPDGDATCTVVLTAKGEQGSTGKSNPMTSFMKLVQRTHPPQQPVTVTELCDLPEAAIDCICANLDKESRRQARLICRTVSRSVSQSIRMLQIDPGSLSKYKKEVAEGPAIFANTNELRLRSISERDDLELLSSALRSAQQFRHLHTFTVEAMQIPKACLPDMMQLLVFSPTITCLHLPDQHFITSTEQRQLKSALEALIGLQELKLPSANSNSGSSSTLQPTVLRRIGRLRCLRVLQCDASNLTDISTFYNLPCLEQLNLQVNCSGSEMTLMLYRMTRLTSLELSGPKLTDALGAGLCALPQLQKLGLSFCPLLTAGILAEVSAVAGLTHLTLPFALDGACLRLLSKLRSLSTLYTLRSLTLDPLGPSHAPLASLTKLATAAIDSHGKGLSSWVPGLKQLVLRRFGHDEALSLLSCETLEVLRATDCQGLQDDAFGAIKKLQRLQRLELAAAPQVTDRGFQWVFGSRMPSLEHLVFGNMPAITDQAFLLVTASCRRLSSCSLSSCPQLTDKTLSRLARCEHLTTVYLRECGRRVTGDGVKALAAGVRVAKVTVSHCKGVGRGSCRGHRSGVQVRVNGQLV